MNTPYDAKDFATPAAQYALLSRETCADGTVCYRAPRWDLTRLLDDLSAGRAFLQQIGGAL